MIIWQVFNRHGRSCIALGDTAEEAIEAARPQFASNWVYAPWREAVPDPAYVFEGMRALPVSSEGGDTVAEALQRYEAAAAALRAGWSSGPAVAARVMSPGCYEASFGMVHVRPGCRCPR